jgi:hypothetical protein
MLILKGNFLLLLRAVLPGLLLCLLAPIVAVAASPEPARAPDAVAAEFYGWYLDALTADQDPLSDRHERFTAYVARELTQRLVERLRTPPLPETDYFLQARSYEPAWRRGLHTALLRREAGSAEVLVTLGGAGVPMRALVLTMGLEGGAWKIRRVRPAPESSPERPAI